MRIVCIKWGTKYSDDYVLKLKAGCERHIPHDSFVCMTDKAVPGVECIPMNTDMEGWWSKLGLFKPDAFLGPNLYLDLDVIVTGSIETLKHQFYYDMTKLYAIDDFSYSLAKPKGVDALFERTLGGPGCINSSIMMWYGGPLSPFSKVLGASHDDLHGDQNLITRELWPEHIRLFNSAGIVGSYKYHGGQVFPITVFHGNPKPADLSLPWIDENWKVA